MCFRDAFFLEPHSLQSNKKVSQRETEGAKSQGRKRKIDAHAHRPNFVLVSCIFRCKDMSD